MTFFGLNCMENGEAQPHQEFPGVHARPFIQVCGRATVRGTKTSINGKMASTRREGSEKAENTLANRWGQLIFTHDSKPPVLISKEVVRLGRKEGEKDQRLCTDLSFLYTCINLAHNFYLLW